MQKILLAALTEEGNQSIRKDLVQLPRSLGTFTLLDTDFKNVVADTALRPNLVILELPIYNQRFKRLTGEMREHGFTGPMIVVGKPEAPDTAQTFRNLRDMIFVEKPYEGKDLVGIVSKLLNERKVQQRIHRRFATSQRAKIEFYDRDDRTDSTLYNLSKGGAYFEYSSATKIRVGDLVKLNIPLDEVQRSYAMSAKVVWVTKAGQYMGGQGVGVEFIGPESVYKHLLGF